VVTVSDGTGTVRFIAVPLGAGGEPVPFLELTDAGGFQVRSDGHALAVAFTNADDSSRIATIDLASGAARWMTADEPGIYDRPPARSRRLARLLYRRACGTAPSLARRDWCNDRAPRTRFRRSAAGWSRSLGSDGHADRGQRHRAADDTFGQRSQRTDLHRHLRCER